MNANDRIIITVSVREAGCLPGLLEQRISEVESHLTAFASAYSPAQKDMAHEFLSQMRGCLESVQAARAAYVKGTAK